MKKITALILISILINSISYTSLTTKAEEAGTEVIAPKWEEYIPKKYRNPRSDFRKGSAIAEMIGGIFLTDLIITSPIGIPMIYHASTKFKNISYSEKKEMFETGLKQAELITDSTEKQIYYKNLLKQCKMTEKNRKKILKKENKV